MFSPFLLKVRQVETPEVHQYIRNRYTNHQKSLQSLDHTDSVFSYQMQQLMTTTPHKLVTMILNQVRAGLSARAWFLEVTFVPPKYVCVCVHPRGYK